MPGIVVGVDGSASSERALAWAMKEAAAHHAPLTVLAVHQAVISHATGEPVSYPDDAPEVADARHAAEEAVRKAASRLGGQQPSSVTVRAVSGIPAKELIEASRDADLVVVGTRGSGGFARLLLGSVSTQVVHHAACPAVVVPAG